MYNNLSLYRDNGLQKQAYGAGTITLSDPNSSELYENINYGDTMGQGGIPPASDGTINISDIYKSRLNTSGIGSPYGQNTGVQHSTLPSTPTSMDINTHPNLQINSQDNAWDTSYTMPQQTQAPQLYPTQPLAYTLPYQGSQLTSQGIQDAAPSQPAQPLTQGTPWSFGSYGFDQGPFNPYQLTTTVTDNYSPTLSHIPGITYSAATKQSEKQQSGKGGGNKGGTAQPPTDIFTSDYMLNNIAPSGALGLGIGALAGALSGGQPVKTGLGTGVGAFGGKMLYDYLANNKDTKQYIQQFQDWASKNLWDGAGEHVQYLAPLLGGLAGFAATK